MALRERRTGVHSLWFSLSSVFQNLFLSFLSPRCGNYKSKAFFFNVKCIYLKKCKINYKPVFAAACPCLLPKRVCPFPCSSSRAGEGPPSRGSDGGKDASAQELWGEEGLRLPRGPGLSRPRSRKAALEHRRGWGAGGPGTWEEQHGGHSWGALLPARLGWRLLPGLWRPTAASKDSPGA